MKEKGILTKTLAIISTILFFIPLLAPVFFSLLSYMEHPMVFRFDYLMPAELFPLALIGAVCLLWASLRSKLHTKLVIGTVVFAIAIFVVGMIIIPTVSGLAEAMTEKTAFALLMVQISLGIYIVSLLVLGIISIMIVRKLFKRTIETT